MTFAILIALLGAAILAEILYTHRQLRRVIARPPEEGPRLQSYPSVTVVRPVRGRDVDAEANFRAALDTGYPGEVETLFIFDDVSDPGYPVACDVVRAHRLSGRPGTADVLVAGPPPHGTTGKLNAMILGEQRACNELIAFGDSDTRPDRDVLRKLVEELMLTPGAGDTFAPVVVNGPAEAAGDVGYAMLINAWYGPSVALCAESSDRAVPFIMGQLMVFKREALRAIGGSACARGQLVDDMYIGTRVHLAGYKNIMIRHPLYIATGGMTLGGFAKLFRRWLLFSRNGLPASFTWPMWVRGFEFWIAALATVIAIGSGHHLAALFPAAALVGFGASLARINRRFGGARVDRRWLWLPFAIPVIAPGCVATTLFNKQVDWRGRAYELDAQARLA
jgi:ceramide glucosyltransferase